MVKAITLRLDDKDFKRFERKKTAMGLNRQMNLSWESFFLALIEDNE